MGNLNIYWDIVILTLIYVIYKNWNSALKILIILCFYSGLASTLGKGIENPYKIILLLLSAYLFLNIKGFTGLSTKDKYLIIAFLVFSITFLYSVTSNGGYFNLVFSQYSKYVTPIFTYFIFKRLILKNTNTFINLTQLFFTLLTIQILLSFVKIFSFGLQEFIVGSMSNIGGGLATPIPVFGFIMVWIYKEGAIAKKDWIFILLLLVIGFASYKRAIWFIMPAVIFMFMYYVPKKISFTRLLYYIPLIPLIFYAGVRLNPTLNREGRIGGSFDLQFTLDYVQAYSFGSPSQYYEVQTGQGRGGATLLLWNKLLNSNSLSFNDYWGFGLEEIYTVDYETFDVEKFGITNKGAASGVFQSYIVSGFVGIFVTIFLLVSILGLIKEHRIRVTMALLLFWDYFFYSGLILRTQALLIMLFYIILYLNLKYDQRLSGKF